MRNLGLIGGLGPGATVHYYQQLVKSLPGELLIVHADVDRVLGDVQRGDRQGLADYLARLIDRLAKGGATVAAISAVTPHFCIRELEKISALPLIDIVEQTNTVIRERGYRTVALFGTRFVVQSSLFGMLEGVDVVVPAEVEHIHDAYMQIVGGQTEGREFLASLAHRLLVDAILLAGTDLSLVFDEANTDFPHVDCAREHIRAIVRSLHSAAPS
ncbi:MAG: aspartate/glutamate racemase family protein [Bryobacteraceae bacterium]